MTYLPSRALKETGGPTVLSMAVVADGEYLRRSGTTIDGDTPAGGSSGLHSGTGSPEGVVTAPVGDIYTQTDAGTAIDALWYKKTGSGNTGWQQVTASTGGGGGSPLIAVTTKTANYTITSSDGIVQADVSGGTFSLTMPAASGVGGQLFLLVKIDSSTTIVTIARTGSDTFEGWAGSQTSLHLRLQYQSVLLQSDGSSKWRVVSRYTPEVSCLATSATTTTATNGAETAITFDGESWDTHTMHDNATNNTRITVPCSGRYRVRGRNRWAAGGTTSAEMFVRKNGTASNWYAFDSRAFLSQETNEVVGTVDLVAADYLELTMSHGDAVTRANVVLANLYPEFEVTLVEPLV